MRPRRLSIPTLIVQEKRIQYPMKRRRGAPSVAPTGQVERISWDEAIDTIWYEDPRSTRQNLPLGQRVLLHLRHYRASQHVGHLNRLENVAQFSRNQNRTTGLRARTQGTMYTAGGFYYQGGVDMDLCLPNEHLCRVP